MVEGALKFVDFPDQYSAKYEISEDLARPILVIRPLVVEQKFFDLGDDAGKISAITIYHADKTEVELSGWDDIGEIDMLIENTLKNRIRIPEVSKVKNYLSDFPELIEILPSVCKVTREKFPQDNAQLSLELDRDIEGQDEQLVLFVRQDHYEGNILEIIDEIRSKYSDSLVGKKAWFIVMTDFASPKE